MRERDQQLELRPRTWGGQRRGAGRKPSPGRRAMPHRRRRAHDPRCPAHVTLRALVGLPSLRSDELFPSVRGALAAASTNAFRLLHFSVQADHLHLVVEADQPGGLRRGIQGLAIRVAKAVNRALGRRGAMWAERYHARQLATPREVRHALVYVLQNWRKHVPGARGLDARSSAAWFTGWRTTAVRLAGGVPVVEARTWLARVGWRRYGLLSCDEHPRARNRGKEPYGPLG